MSILLVTSFFPFPSDHGDALRIQSLVESLQTVDKLTVLAVARRDTDADSMTAFRQKFPDAELELMQRSWIGASDDFIRRIVRLFAGILLRVPPLVLAPYSAEAARFVRNNSAEYDRVILVGEPSGMYARKVRHDRLIWDKANVLTAYSRFALNVTKGLRRVHHRLNLVLAKSFEGRVSALAEVWVTSELEAQKLLDEFAVRAALVLPSVVEAPELPATLVWSNPRIVVWLSTFAYEPNWHGLVRLVEALAGRRDGRSIMLRVVGSGASAAQRAWLQSHPYVDYWGYVDDLRVAFDGSAAGVVPIWSGAGVKLKTLTMLSYGVPVFATEVAMEGIPLDAACFVSNDIDEIVNGLIDADESLSIEAGRRGREIVARDYSRTSFRDSVVSRVG